MAEKKDGFGCLGLIFLIALVGNIYRHCDYYIQY